MADSSSSSASVEALRASLAPLLSAPEPDLVQLRATLRSEYARDAPALVTALTSLAAHGSSLLFSACLRGHVALVHTLLSNAFPASDAAALSSAQDALTGGTPLHAASAEGHERVVALLLRRGARSDARDSAQNTPRDVAVGDAMLLWQDYAKLGLDALGFYLPPSLDATDAAADAADAATSAPVPVTVTAPPTLRALAEKGRQASNALVPRALGAAAPWTSASEREAYLHAHGLSALLPYYTTPGYVAPASAPALYALSDTRADMLALTHARPETLYALLAAPQSAQWTLMAQSHAEFAAIVFATIQLWGDVRVAAQTLLDAGHVAHDVLAAWLRFDVRYNAGRLLGPEGALRSLVAHAPAPSPSLARALLAPPSGEEEPTSPKHTLSLSSTGALSPKEKERTPRLLTATWGALSSRLTGDSAGAKERAVSVRSEPVKALLDVPVSELADELCASAHELYLRIVPSELHAHNWTRADAATKAPALSALIAHLNHVAQWLATELLKEADLNTLTAKLAYAVQLGDALRARHDYATLSSVMGALASSAVAKLTRAHDALQARYPKLFALKEALQVVVSPLGHYRAYKAEVAALDASVCACVPLLAVTCGELNALDEALSDVVDARVHWSKMTLLSERVHDALRWRVPYTVPRSPHVRAYVQEQRERTWQGDAALWAVAALRSDDEGDSIAEARTHSIFTLNARPLSVADMESALAAACATRTCARGERIEVPSDGSAFFFVQLGTLAVRERGAAADAPALTTLSEGAFVALTTLVGAREHGAEHEYVVESSSAQLLQIDVAHVRRLCDADPELGERLYRFAAQTLAHELDALTEERARAHRDAHDAPAALARTPTTPLQRTAPRGIATLTRRNGRSRNALQASITSAAPTAAASGIAGASESLPLLSLRRLTPRTSKVDVAASAGAGEIVASSGAEGEQSDFQRLFHLRAAFLKKYACERVRKTANTPCVLYVTAQQLCVATSKSSTVGNAPRTKLSAAKVIPFEALVEVSARTDKSPPRLVIRYKEELKEKEKSKDKDKLRHSVSSRERDSSERRDGEESPSGKVREKEKELECSFARVPVLERCVRFLRALWRRHEPAESAASALLPSPIEWASLVLKAAHTVTLAAGDVLVSRGDTRKALFQLAQGSVASVPRAAQHLHGDVDALPPGTVERLSSACERGADALPDSGALFGIEAFLSDGVQRASIVATSDNTRIYVIEAFYLNVLFTYQPQFASRFYYFLGAVLEQKRLRLGKREEAAVQLLPKSSRPRLVSAQSADDLFASSSDDDV